MKLLADWILKHKDMERRIELYRGDLSNLPPEHRVDILVVSASRSDYEPTSGSLIGALHRRGISVQQLARIKDKDFREEFSCWLSLPLELPGFSRILCIESGWRGTPPQIAEDVFRALAPISLMDVPTSSIAMPLIGTGDQGCADDRMLESIVLAAVSWIERGMPVDVLKIVAYSQESADAAERRFVELKASHVAEPPDRNAWDVFLSYCHHDIVEANHVHSTLSASLPNIRIYQDQRDNEEGGNWVLGAAEALDSSHRVLALYTPSYWKSKYCKLEFTAAFMRQTDTGRNILFPVYYREAAIPSLFGVLHYADCREADLGKLTDACRKLSLKL